MSELQNRVSTETAKLLVSKEIIGNTTQVKGNREYKLKVHPRTCHEGPEGEYSYSSIVSLTSKLEVD